jgi:hypothetical protein
MTSLFERLVRQNPKASLTLLGTIATAMGAGVGPWVVSRYKEAAAVQTVKSELVRKVIDSTATLDPADPKTILRFGIVADLINDNQGVFGLQVEKASGRLERLSSVIRQSPIGVTDESRQRQERELTVLQESTENLRAQAARLGTISSLTLTTVEQASLAAAKANLETAIARQEALIEAVKRLLDAEGVARDIFVTEVGRTTLDQQRLEALTQMVDDLNRKASLNEDSRRGLDQKRERVDEALRDGMARINSASQRLDARERELSERGTQLENERRDLETEKALVQAAACAKGDMDRLLADLSSFGGGVSAIQRGSDSLAVTIRYSILTPVTQTVLSRVIARLIYFKLNQRQVLVHGFAFDKKGKRRVTESINKAMQALTIIRSLVKGQVDAENFSVAAFEYPALDDSPVDRIQLSIAPTAGAAH